MQPFDNALQIINDEIGCESFSDISITPIASASIAQVHRATLKSTENITEKVAIKVLRPQIHIHFKKNIKMLKSILRLLTMNMDHNLKLRIYEMVHVLDRSVIFELDLLKEAAACDELRENICGDFDVKVPKVYWNYCTENVMVTEWIDGVSVYEADQLGINKTLIAQRIAIMFFNQTYRDGYFHADLHPGNILITSDGKISLVDFGIMGHLRDQDRIGIAKILYYFFQRNYNKVAEIHLELGYIPYDSDLKLFAQSCRAVVEPILHKPVKDISIGILLGRLLKMSSDCGMQAQPQLLMLQKTMVVVEGIGRILDPDINMWALAEPWIHEWAKKNINCTSEAKRKIKDIFDRAVHALLYKNINDNN
jgi:ubiquinone biosynthesis protein